MTDKWLEEIREKISCPQLGDDHYGEWGILTKNQRFTIKRMLDFIDAQEAEIERLTKYYEIRREIVYRNYIDDLSAEAEIKAEAYKEFAELLFRKAEIRNHKTEEYHYVLADDIVDLLKELVGESQ